MEPQQKAVVAGWAAQASHLIGDYFDICKPFTDKDYQGLNPLVRFVTAQLYIACHLTSESTLLLVQLDKAWDADILCRSIIEGTAKYAYILQGDDEEIWIERANEYWHIHPEIMLKKDCDRAEELKEQFPKGGLIDDEVLEPLNEMISLRSSRSGYWASISKQERKKLDGRWSVGGIIEHFNNAYGSSNNPLRGFFYYYGNSCHLSHMDGIGIANIWDRYRRDQNRRAAVTFAHHSRIVGDVATYAKIRALELLRACGAQTDDVFRAEGKYETLFRELNTAYRQFHAVEYGKQVT